MRHRNPPLWLPVAGWAILALIKSVWAQIQCFREKRSCITNIPSSYCSQNLLLNTQLLPVWDKHTSLYESSLAQTHNGIGSWPSFNHGVPSSGSTTMGRNSAQLTHHKKSSGSLMLAQENTQNFYFGKIWEANNNRILLLALLGAVNIYDDTQGPPPQNESDVTTVLTIGWVSQSKSFFAGIWKNQVLV